MKYGDAGWNFNFDAGKQKIWMEIVYHHQHGQSLAPRYFTFQTISHHLTFTPCRFRLAPFHLQCQIILTDLTEIAFAKFSNLIRSIHRGANLSTAKPSHQSWPKKIAQISTIKRFWRTNVGKSSNLGRMYTEAYINKYPKNHFTS